MHKTTNRIDVHPEQLSLDSAIHIFLSHHGAALSRDYQGWLLRRLNHLANYVGRDRAVATITITDLDFWHSTVLQKYLAGEWSADYTRGYGVAVKTFFNWLGKRRYIQSNPAALLTPKEISETPPKAISDAAASAMLELTRSHPRNYALTLFLLRTGVRAHEASGLLRSNLRLPERYAHVIGKGKRGAKQQRVVVFDDETRQALQDWLAVAPRSQLVFTSVKRGEAGNPIGPGAVLQMCQDCRDGLREMGIFEPVNPQRIRHYWGVTAARLGASESFIMQQMGHRDPKTTQRYTKFTPQRLRQAYDRVFGPL